MRKPVADRRIGASGDEEAEQAVGARARPHRERGAHGGVERRGRGAVRNALRHPGEAL